MALIDALQAALAGEHAAVYAYGVGGAHLGGDAGRQALDWLDGHREARDALGARVRRAGGEPVGPRAAYALPFPISGGGSGRRLLALVEQRLADLYGDVVAADPPGHRRLDAIALAGCAVRATRWSGRAEAFPGFVEPPA